MLAVLFSSCQGTGIITAEISCNAVESWCCKTTLDLNDHYTWKVVLRLHLKIDS